MNLVRLLTMRRMKVLQVLFAVFFFGTVRFDYAESTPSGRQSVSILLSSDTNIYADGLSGIQSVIQAGVKIQYLDVLLSEFPDIADYFSDLESSNPPLVITIGPAATRAALTHIRRTPVIFSMVNSPRTFGMIPGKSCGVSMDISIRDFFRTLRDLSPSARRVGAFYSSQEGEFVSGEGDYMDLRSGIYFARKKIEDRERFEEALESMQNIDAFYMVADPLYDRARFEQLSRYCREHHIILMTQFSSLVKAGATFALTPDYSRIGLTTGQMANRILAGTSTCEQEGVRFPEETSFYLNEEYARESGIAIPDSLRERARLTGLFNTGVNLMAEGKLRSALIVFNSIIGRDTSNQAALSYRDFVMERLSGDETRKLMADGERYFRENNFSAAAQIYERVLRINPNLSNARNSLEKSLLAKSEQERNQGNRLERESKLYEAIRFYQAAVTTLPANQAARNDLENIRRILYPNLNALLQSGINHYNNREYDQAISEFQNIMLVDPGQKQAAEYLRLSLKKKEALERLLRN